jgi:folate-binding protein YgfZ
LITTASVLEALEARLRKYVLRSKVRLERDRLAVGACAPGDGDFHPPLSERAHVQKGDVSYVRLPGHRQLLGLAAPASTAYSSDASADAIWRADDIAAGLPQIYPQTHESFVAQMLNLDVLGGISFTKGCYTGQEIIARAHYRGAVKRRMLRFTGPGPAPAPGTRLLSGDQHAGDVVDAVAVDVDRCELLAVVALDKAEAALRCDTPEAGDLHRSPLPYESALRDLGASRTA